MKDFSHFISKQSSFPVMGKAYDTSQYVLLDLGINRPAYSHDSTTNLAEIIEAEMISNPTCLLYGGYMEHRAIYQSSHFAESTAHPRCIHLGVDIWTHAGTGIHAPLAGTVHSFQYNAAELDYGYTIILQHTIHDCTFYTLYGHLSDFNFNRFEIGQEIELGEVFCRLGPPTQNGGWPPHLHFQVISDMQGRMGDFPGVVTVDEAEKYSHLCPDPTQLALGFGKT